MNFSLTIGLFKNFLINFQAFRDFLVILLLVISSLIPLRALHDFNSLQLVEIYSVAQNMYYFGKYFLFN